jgi:hypothetical protein
MAHSFLNTKGNERFQRENWAKERDRPGIPCNPFMERKMCYSTTACATKRVFTSPRPVNVGNAGRNITPFSVPKNLHCHKLCNWRELGIIAFWNPFAHGVYCTCTAGLKKNGPAFFKYALPSSPEIQASKLVLQPYNSRYRVLSR